VDVGARSRAGTQGVGRTKRPAASPRRVVRQTVRQDQRQSAAARAAASDDEDHRTAAATTAGQRVSRRTLEKELSEIRAQLEDAKNKYVVL